MKKFILFIVTLFIVISFVGCGNSDTNIDLNVPSETTENDILSTEATTKEDVNSEETTEQKGFNIGDEVELGGIKFNIYKTTENDEVFLLAQKNIAITTFSDSERPYDKEHDYAGSLVEKYVKKFVYKLEDMGYIIKSSGIMDKDDLFKLGFIKSETVSGRPYLCDETPDFIKLEENFWLDGYYRVETYQWAYYDEKIDTQSCDLKFGVRPIVVIDVSEFNKKPKDTSAELSIKEIVDAKSAWVSEGGIENPYDKYYFDCEKMVFKNVFNSPEMNFMNEYEMNFIDEKTIYVENVDRFYGESVYITVVNANKLRIRFLDEDYNDEENFLNKEK